ncbi:MAG TPA: hypothetical protein VGJ44_09970 [Kribbellaceae bacterium]
MARDSPGPFSNGAWISPTIYATRRDGNESGSKFEYVVVAVNGDVAQQFIQLRKTYSSIPRLPVDVSPFDRVMVVRE